MSSDAIWQRLLLTLYASITDRQAAESLPDLISAWVGGTRAALWLTDAGKAPVEVPVTNGPVEGAALYVEHYHRHDPWAAQFFTDNTGQVVRGSMSIGDTQLDRSLFYNEFGRHFGLFHQMNTTFVLAADKSHLYSTLSVLRAKHAEAFSDPEVDRLQRLVPHLKQAMSLRAQIGHDLAAARTGALAAMVDALPIAACVVDGNGRLLKANCAMEAMSSPGMRLFSKTAGELVVTCRSSTERRKLLRAISDAALGHPGGIETVSADTGQDVQISITPIQADELRRVGWASGLALLVLKHVGVPDLNTLQRVGIAAWNFTDAESGVAAALAAGKSPKQIAAERGTKISTVRTLLLRAQDKASASNLRQLVSILSARGG